jgi:hypothetical protein
MTDKLKIIFVLQAIIALMIIFLINYYALKLSFGWSIAGGLAFVLVVGGWAAYRLKRYREKERKKAESDPGAGK